MRIIKSLNLINFQIHQNITVEFDKGFNCITGMNNRGKSSIIRAFYWLYTNVSGDWMRRTGTDITIAKLNYSDGTSVSRIKGRGVNDYVVCDAEGKEDKYSDIGRTGIPEQVKEVFGIDYSMYEKMKLFQHIDMQGGNPFLVYETPSRIAGAINFITGVNIIEDAIKDFSKDKAEHRTELKILKRDLIDAEDTVSAYDGVEKIDTGSINKKLSKLAKLQDEIDQIKEINATIKQTNSITKFGKVITFIARAINDLLYNLEKLDIEKSKYSELILIVDNYNTKLPDFNPRELLKSIDALQGLHNQIIKINEDVSKINTIASEYMGAVGNAGNIAMRLDKAKSKLSDIDGELCEVCGSKIDAGRFL